MFFETHNADSTTVQYACVRLAHPGADEDDKRLGFDKPMVLVRQKGEPAETPTWMDYHDAVNANHYQIILRDNPKRFRHEFSAMIVRYGLKSVQGEIDYVPVNVIERAPRMEADVDGFLGSVQDARRALDEGVI